jgi:hypothetical protein
MTLVFTNFSEKYYNTSQCTTRMFNQQSDWAQELTRCNAKEGWRVLTLDRIDTNSLPMYYVVPKNMTDAEYFKLSRHFRNTRAAIWVSCVSETFVLCLHNLLLTFQLKNIQTKRQNDFFEINVSNV